MAAVLFYMFGKKRNLCLSTGQMPVREFWVTTAIAWILSSYGLPFFAGLLVEGLDAVTWKLGAI